MVRFRRRRFLPSAVLFIRPESLFTRTGILTGILGEVLHLADQSLHRFVSPALEPTLQCTQLPGGVV
jgi:hypothetical protein